MLSVQCFQVPHLPDQPVPRGKSLIWREGIDITLACFVTCMNYAPQAADQRAEIGVSAVVIYPRCLRPLDTETVVNSAKKTNRCVTIEERFPVCSIGSHISSVLMQAAFAYLDAPVMTCTGKDVPMPYAANLEKLALVTTAEVMTAAKSVLYR